MRPPEMTSSATGRAARSRSMVLGGQLMLAALFALMSAGGGHAGLGIAGGWLAHHLGYVAVLGLAVLALVMVSVAVCCRDIGPDPFSEKQCDANA